VCACVLARTPARLCSCVREREILCLAVVIAALQGVMLSPSLVLIVTAVPVCVVPSHPSDRMQSDVYYLSVLWENVTLSCEWFFFSIFGDVSVFKALSCSLFSLCVNLALGQAYTWTVRITALKKLHENNNWLFLYPVFLFCLRLQAVLFEVQSILWLDFGETIKQRYLLFL
jgi:hypothetical protein